MMIDRKFELGQVVATSGALGVLEEVYADNNSHLTPFECAMCFVMLHVQGKWGSICPEDAKLNEQAIKDKKNRGRVVSSYDLNDNAKIWVITEADRSTTTVLLPEEY